MSGAGPVGVVVPSAAGDPSAATYRSGHRWAAVTQVALAACAAALTIELAVDLSTWRMVEVASGSASADSAGLVESIEGLERGASSERLFTIPLLVAAVAFLGWLSRSVANLPALTGHRSTFSPSAAVGWWFVPIANWWQPYRAVKEVSEKLALRLGTHTSAWLLPTWWALWLAGTWAIPAVGLGVAVAGASQPALDWLAIDAVVSLVIAIDAVLAILVVRRLEAASRTAAELAGLRPISGVGRAATPTRTPAVAATAVAAVPVIAFAALVLAPVPAGTGESAWRAFRPADGSFQVDLPGDPASAGADRADGASWAEHRLERSNHTLRIMALRLPGGLDPGRQLDEVRAALVASGRTIASWRPTTHAGFPAARVITRAGVDESADGGSWGPGWVDQLVVVAGDWLHVVADVHPDPAPPAELARIIGSFRPVTPG